MLNVASMPGDDRLAEGVSGTLATEFPLVLTWQALRFNQFVIGLDRAEPRELLVRRLARGPARFGRSRTCSAGICASPLPPPTRGRTTVRPSSGSPTG